MTFFTDFGSFTVASAIWVTAERQEMEIDLRFPAEELGIFRRVNKDLQTVLEVSGRA